MNDDLALQIEQSIAAGDKQDRVAVLYAWAIVANPQPSWPRINKAVTDRWPKGLDRVKAKAWRVVDGWRA